MLCLVVALPCEARPLIEHFALRAGPAHGFRTYHGEAAALVVSGVGKAAAAAATAWLQMQVGGGPHVWLNCGIAGHRTRPVGEALMAHKVTDGASGRSWYPPLVEAPPCVTDTLVTVDSPERDFAEGCAYDMEAAGFYPTACRFATAELVHCYKVVSDGAAEAGAQPAAAAVTALIRERVGEIATVAGGLQAAAQALADRSGPCALEAYCLARWRFTQTQRHQLARACRRARAVGLDAADLLARVDSRAGAGEVLKRLDEALAAVAPRFEASEGR